MRIVRTVGQAFEVCHKFNLHKNSLEPNDERSDVSSSELLDVEQISEQQLSEDGGLLPVLASETPKKGKCVCVCVCAGAGLLERLITSLGRWPPRLRLRLVINK